MENSDQAAVKVLGSSMVRLYDRVFSFFQPIRSMVLSAPLCMRYWLGSVIEVIVQAPALEVGGFDHQRVAFPMADRIAAEGGLDVLVPSSPFTSI
jgi:hypothetical protein